MTPHIDIFTAPLCGACQEAKAYFDERGLVYTSYELKWGGDDWEDTPAARNLKQRCGDIDFVPQIFINGRHIKGWAELSTLIESGDIDKILTK